MTSNPFKISDVSTQLKAANTGWTPKGKNRKINAFDSIMPDPNSIKTRGYTIKNANGIEVNITKMLGLLDNKPKITTVNSNNIYDFKNKTVTVLTGIFFKDLKENTYIFRLYNVDVQNITDDSELTYLLSPPIVIDGITALRNDNSLRKDNMQPKHEDTFYYLPICTYCLTPVSADKHMIDIFWYEFSDILPIKLLECGNKLYIIYGYDNRVSGNSNENIVSRKLLPGRGNLLKPTILNLSNITDINKIFGNMLHEFQSECFVTLLPPKRTALYSNLSLIDATIYITPMVYNNIVKKHDSRYDVDDPDKLDNEIDTYTNLPPFTSTIIAPAITIDNN